MNNETKLLKVKARLMRLEGTNKNIKCPGVVRKLRRQVRNYSK